MGDSHYFPGSLWDLTSEWEISWLWMFINGTVIRRCLKRLKTRSLIRTWNRLSIIRRRQGLKEGTKHSREYHLCVMFEKGWRIVIRRRLISIIRGLGSKMILPKKNHQTDHINIFMYLFMLIH